MTQAKFGEGERVSIKRSSALPGPAGVYRVLRALPLEAGPRQYRVRGEAETFDRVMDESRLQAVTHD